jgi:hypothetical protein
MRLAEVVAGDDQVEGLLDMEPDLGDRRSVCTALSSASAIEAFMVGGSGRGQHQAPCPPGR